MTVNHGAVILRQIEVQDRVAALGDIGVTDFAAVEVGATPDEVAEHTRQLLAAEHANEG